MDVNNKRSFLKTRAGLLIGCAVILLSFTLGVYTLTLLLNERLESKRWSYAYFVTIHSKTIKKCPIVKPIGSPKFIYKMGDGPAPQMQGVSYQSSEEREVLITLLCNYLEHLGYTRLKEGDLLDFAFEKDGLRCEFSISPGERNNMNIYVLEMHYN